MKCISYHQWVIYLFFLVFELGTEQSLSFSMKSHVCMCLCVGDFTLKLWLSAEIKSVHGEHKANFKEMVVELGLKPWLWWKRGGMERAVENCFKSQKMSSGKYHHLLPLWELNSVPFHVEMPLSISDICLKRSVHRQRADLTNIDSSDWKEVWVNGDGDET